MGKRDEQTAIAVYKHTKKRFDRTSNILKERGLIRSADDLIDIALNLIEIEFKIEKENRRYN